MKVSIIGTNGFLSSAIGKFANQARWELYMYGLNKPVDHAFDYFGQTDLINDSLDFNHIKDSDIIIYASGAGIQSNLKENSEVIYKLNVTVPITICNKLKELDYKGCLITFGSVFEMGENSIAQPFSENEIITSQFKAPNDYTISKRILTRFIDSYHHDFTHWHFIIPTIYGKGENPLRLIPYVINSIKSNEKVFFTSGEQTRQYVHVSEVPRLIDLSYNKKLPSGIYNIQGNETLTVKQIVELIYRSFGKVVPEGSVGAIKRADVGVQ